MDLRSGIPYFLIRSGLPYDHPTLRTDLRCEVLVVGGGITGALCAHACTQAGLDTVVIDKRAIGTGSTSASTALLQYEIDVPLHKLARKVGVDHAVRSYQACATAVEHIVEQAGQWPETQVMQRKSLQYASRRSHVEALRTEQALRTQHGFHVDLLDAASIEGRFHLKAPAALLSHTAAEIDPYRYTHALFQDAEAMGARVFDHTAMQDHKRNGEAHVVQTEEGNSIRCDHLIMATGYESQRMLAAPHVDLHSTYAVVSEQLHSGTFWEDDALIWETAQPYLYLRTTPDRRIIIGGLDEKFRDPERRDALMSRKTRNLERAIAKLFPHIPFKTEFAWCGTFGSTTDGLPYIDRDARSGAWFVLGMGGNGITFSQVGAAIVRDALLNKPNRDRELFRFDR